MTIISHPSKGWLYSFASRRIVSHEMKSNFVVEALRNTDIVLRNRNKIPFREKSVFQSGSVVALGRAKIIWEVGGMSFPVLNNN
ncbi:hypothetical protein BIV60_25825 [Bacillus sp. MUM 116]|nr:hypothetical protein BIV60_25825 [Bacillus sp. MUM 116]